MAKIKITSKCELYDGMSITFKAPCDCTAVDGLNVYYNNVVQSFSFRDAHGNNLAGLKNLFSEGTYVKAILDTGNGYAYLQNADTNGYLEDTFNTLESRTYTKEQALSDITKTAYGLDSEAVPDDVLAMLSEATVANITNALGDWEWTASTLTAASLGYGSIMYGNGILAVVDTSNKKVHYSEDGSTWTTASINATGSINQCAFCNGLFFCCASSGYLVYSSDCATWTEVRPMSNTNTLYGITYWKGKYWIGRDDGKVMYSADLSSWSVCSQTFSGCRKIASCDSAITVHYGGSVDGKYWYSTNGTSWTESALPYSVQQNTVKSLNGKIFVLGAAGSTAQYLQWTSDGVNWEHYAYTGYNSMDNCADIVFTGKEYLLFTTYRTHYSSDGQTWVVGDNTPTTNHLSAAYAFGKVWANGYTSSPSYPIYSGVPVYETKLQDVHGNLLSIQNSQIVGGIQFATGSYSGTGSSGTLSFDFVPKLLIVTRNSSTSSTSEHAGYIGFPNKKGIFLGYTTNTPSTSSGITGTSKSATMPLTTSGVTFNYIAIGY